jgi:hypothetical protein
MKPLITEGIAKLASKSDFSGSNELKLLLDPEKSSF